MQVPRNVIIREERANAPASIGKNPAGKQEFVMTSSIATGVTVFFIVFGVWAANLVCYHSVTDLDPTTPVSLTMAR
jgi:hypothetical protein